MAISISDGANTYVLSEPNSLGEEWRISYLVDFLPIWTKSFESFPEAQSALVDLLRSLILAAAQEKPSTDIVVGQSWGTATITLREGSPDERMTVDYGEPVGCSHVETMCPECLPNWSNDYEIELPCGCSAGDIANGHDLSKHPF